MPAAALALAAGLACSSRTAPPRAGPDAAPLVLEPAWRLDLHVGVPLSLRALDGGFVLISASGRALFVDGETGTLGWETDLEAPLAGEPTRALPGGAGGQGWLAVPTQKGVVALSAADGGVLSRLPSPEENLHLTAIPEGLLVLDPSSSAALVSPAGGPPLWEVRLPSPATAPAASCGSQIVVGMENGRLAGLDRASGELRWTKKLGSPAAVRPACTARHAIVATVDNTIHALRLHRRSAGRMWRTRTGADPAAPPAIEGQTVLLLSKDTYLYGLRKRNGHLIFRIRLGWRPSPAAILRELILVAGVQATRLAAYRLPLGLNAGGFDLPPGSRFVTPPVVSGDRVALGVAKFGETDHSSLIALSAARVEEAASGEDP